MIPLYKPHLEKKEVDATLRVLQSGKLTRGKEVETFEKDFAAYTGQKHAVAVNSGTSGLHLAVRALGWKAGDEVITTPFSFIASSNALLFEGVKPVFVDIDPSTLNIDVSSIEAKITKKTKGILLVHILGLPVDDLRTIKRLKKKYGLKIIEDACEAIGRPSSDFPVTKFGELSVYSFHENKPMTTGEGGMITTDDARLAALCSSMKEQGRSTKKDWLDNVILGFNFRLTEMQAAIGSAQLASLDQALQKRGAIAETYHTLLKGVAGIRTPQELSPGRKRSWFAYFIMCDTASDREKLHRALSEAGIGSSTHYFPPIYRFPMYAKYRTNACSNTESASKRLLVLPMFYEMTDAQIKEVAEVIKKTLT